MIVFTKAHPATQAMSAARAPADLREGGLYRNPGEPGAAEAEAGEYSKPRIKWQGLTIAVENPAGSVRRGRNRHGVTWEVRMRFDYGEILGTMGVDGDPVDVIVGPNLDAPMVYVVHQRRVNDWTEFDEDKCCVGFDSQADAEQAFLSNYNDPRFLGPVTPMPVAEFVAKVRATRDAPAMIKAVLFFKSYVGPYLRGGRIVQGYHGRTARAVATPGQLSLFGSNKPLGPSPFKGADPVASTPDLFDADEHGEMPPGRSAYREPQPEEPTGEHDHLLQGLPDGTKWRRGKGLIRDHYGVEVDGEVLGNYHAKPEDAVAAARQSLSTRASNEKASADHAAAVGKLRDRLLAGGDVTDMDLKLLGLKDGSSGLEWFIPAAAKVFDISSRAVRPHIADMIRIGHTDMGAKKEFVAPKKALRAIAAGLTQKPSAGTGIHEWADRETAPVGAWVKADFKLADSQPVYQVRDLPLDDLYLPELDSSGRLQPEKRKYLDGYTERAKAGERAPSIMVIEMESGKLRVVDGHRRALAARAAGKTTIRALVSPLIDTPDGKKEATAELVSKKPDAQLAEPKVDVKPPDTDKKILFVKPNQSEQPNAASSNLINNSPVETKQESKMKDGQVSYTFANDVATAVLRGKTFTGGKLENALISGKLVEVFKFAEKVNGQGVTARVAGKPELEAAAAEIKASAAKEKADARQALEAAVPGLSDYEAAARKYSNAEAAYDRASERGYPQKEAAAAKEADTELQAVMAEYPATAMWRKVESYMQASNYSKSAAGGAAKSAIMSGTPIAEAVAKMEADWNADATRAAMN